MRTDGLNRQAMSEGDVMTNLVQFRLCQFGAGSIGAIAIPGIDELRALVDCKNMLHTIGQSFCDITRVTGECLRRLTRLPAAETVLQCLGQVPVIKRGERFDAVGEQFVHQPMVEIETFRVWRTSSFRKNTRPRDRKTIGFHAQRLHQLHVFLVAMIVVVGAVGIAAVDYLARRVRKSIPDRRSAAVFPDGAFDLKGRRRSAPEKAFWKMIGHFPACRSSLVLSGPGGGGC